MKNTFVPILLVSFVSLVGCTPTIAVKTPDKPLEINLNVKVDHNITVKIDKELDQVINNNEDIF